MADRVLAETPYLRFIDRDGWAFVERPGIRGVVCIVAVTADRRLLLVEQDRKPMGGPVVELPAGLAGDAEAPPDEELADTARRELLEETGFAAASMTLLARCPTSPGMTNELVSFFLAGDLRKETAGGGVGGERIVVHAIPLESVDAFLEGCVARGLPVAAKVFSGLYLAQRAGAWARP